MASDIALGINADATKNFLWRNNNDGSCELRRGNGSKIITVDATGHVFMPVSPGSIIQMASFESDAGSNHSLTTLSSLSAGTKNFTPKSTNSILLVECSFYGQINLVSSANTIATFRLMEGSAGVGDAYDLGVATGSGGNQVFGPCTVRARLTNAALTSRGFTLGGQTNNTSAAVTANKQVFTITEIQA